jgi:predicted RNA-binding Zn-ribbon protein involved in translation (DUF1610 family)
MAQPADTPSEMTSIRTKCPQCGEVEMQARGVLLTVEPASGEGSYSFVCPMCDQVVEKPADKRIASLLMSIGVEVEERDTQELDPEVKPEGPPFTLDDVIDFHFLLDQDDWFEALTASAE